MFENVKLLVKTKIAKMINKSDINYSIWVFSSSNNTAFNYNSKYLFEYVLKNKKEILPLYVINDDDTRTELKKMYGEEYFIETKSLKGILKVLNAGVWFTSAGLPVYGFNLSKDRLIINLWHGVPLKKIALMENHVSNFKKIYFKKIFSDNLTHVLTTSKALIPTMSRSFNVNEDKIKVWGQPRNDALFKLNDKKKILSALYGKLPEYNKIILYAPTYRDNKDTYLFPFKDMNYIDFNNYLKEKRILIFIRGHQFDTSLANMEFGDRIKFINSNKQNEIMDILNIFDLLITDYSSIYIDYLLTNNPVLFLPYDKSNYFSDRGMNFDYDKVTPGPKPNSYKKFKTEVDCLLNSDKYYLSERKKINNFFNEINYRCSSYIYESIKSELDTQKENTKS